MIGVFENDIMYGCVVSVPRPSANKFDYIIQWNVLCLPNGFPITHYPLCTSIDNTDAMKLRLQLAINRANMGNYMFTEPISQIVQSQE